MWPFKRKPIVDADTARWHAENFAWLVASFGGSRTFATVDLVLPRPGFFPFDGEEGHAKALRIFEQVKDYCGMREWPVCLVQDRDAASAHAASASRWVPVPQRQELGTFSVSGDTVQITYEEALLAHPQRLIATFAHELAHYLLATAPTAPPCADDEHEFLTDLTAVYLGFGVFMANAVYDFQAMHDGVMHGWSSGRSGYLPEPDFIFATALFLVVKELDPTPAYECLKPHLATLLKRALRDLAVDTHVAEQVRASIRAADEREASPGSEQPEATA